MCKCNKKDYETNKVLVLFFSTYWRYGIEDGPEQNLIPVLKDSGDSRSSRTSCPWGSVVRIESADDWNRAGYVYGASEG